MFDTSNVTDMSSMFQSDSSLENLDLTNFDTSKVTNMKLMFYSVSTPELDLSNFDTSNVTDMESMFYSVSTPELDLKNFDISSVTNMRTMFSNSNVDKIDISGWNFNIKSLYEFFSKSNASKLILDDIDTSSVEDMHYMFANMPNLKNLDLSSLDTGNVTTMEGMFSGCYNLESLDLSSFDTSNVTNMSKMFYQCSNILEYDLSSFNVYNVTNMESMFAGNEKIKNIDLSSFDTSKVTNMHFMLASCYSLKTVDFSNFYCPNLRDVSGMFSSDSVLERIYANDAFIPDNIPYTYLFSGDVKLVGGMGTRYNKNNISTDYARVDDPENGKPGYFTYKEFKPTIYYPNGETEESELGYMFTLPNDYPKADENVATVTFKYQNGEEDTVSYVTKNYSFSKWKHNGTEYVGGSVLKITFDTYLEAIYNETIQAAVFPETPTSEHATFLGWYTEPTGGEEVTSYNGEEDITLYAHWDAEDMTISFEENGGEEISDIAIPYGSEIGELPTTTKTGFILEGWYSDEELTNKVLSSTVVNDNMALYAKWIEDDFPIVYQDDEEVFDGTNYLNTHIKLYNEENASKDYEIGFTIEEFDESIQEQYATFVQDKYELESAGYPGLVVRLGSEDSVLKTNIGHKRNDDDRGNVYIDNYPVVKLSLIHI